ncbi:MAG TPA: FtsX-like permease family protein, partial [Gemmatimonadales bacterium]|nr:FtsX-like permease family protein [Gemmatimonadales bacterium]
RQVRLGNDAGPRTVVGVVGDVRDVALDQAPPSMVYYPYSQRPEAIFTLVVRTAQDPRLSATAIRRELASLDPDLAVFITRTMDDLTAGTLQRRRFILMLLGGFAVAAVVMAAIGLYGLVGYMVVQRTREIGIRVALGAGPAAVQRLLYREGGGLALGGVALGLLGSLLATRLLQSQLVGISPLDPVAIAGTAVVLLLVCLLATAIPARRVTRLDPLAALRDG